MSGFYIFCLWKKKNKENLLLSTDHHTSGDGFEISEMIHTPRKTSLSIQQNHRKELLQELSDEKYIQGCLEKFYAEYAKNKDIERIIPLLEQQCVQTNYNQLFDTDDMREEVINQDLFRVLVNHCLGPRGRIVGIMATHMEQLIDLVTRWEQGSGGSFFTGLQLLGAELNAKKDVSDATRYDLFAKASIMMILSDTQLPHLDKFIEKNSIIPDILSGKTYSEMINSTLKYAGGIAMKNYGYAYDYKLDNLVRSLEDIADRLRAIPNILGDNKVTDALKRRGKEKLDPVLDDIQTWYTHTQVVLCLLAEDLNQQELHDLYAFLSVMYWDKPQGLSSLLDEEFIYKKIIGSNIPMYHVLPRKVNPDMSYMFNFTESVEQVVEKYPYLVNKVWDLCRIKHEDKSANKSLSFRRMLFLERAKSRKGFNEGLMSHARSDKARNLPCVLDGDVVLRPDQKIDIPSLGIEGIALLTTTNDTDEKNWSLVQGTYVDKYGRKGVADKTYFIPEKAQKVAKNQGLQFFKSHDVKEKTKAVLDKFGKTEVLQSNALQEVFGTGFSGFFSGADKARKQVGFDSFICTGEVDESGCIHTLLFHKDGGAFHFTASDPKISTGGRSPIIYPSSSNQFGFGTSAGGMRLLFLTCEKY